jgi:hypothetical protein
MAGPAIYLCVRRTLDWQDEAQVEANLMPHFRPKVRVWNATFDVPYHVFRHRLKQIAQMSLGRVTDALCAPPEAIPHGAIVAPVDDDDWFAPDLAERIREAYDPTAVGYRWIRGLIEVPVPAARRPWYHFWRSKGHTCDTNNYAISNFADAGPLLRSHIKAGRYFDEHRDRIKQMPGVLGIQNRNVSSQTAIGWRHPSVTRDELVRSHERHRALYASLELSPELGWARPYVDRMAELMQQLGVR